MKQEYPEFCPVCGMPNDDDGPDCLYCGEEFSPVAKKKETRKRGGSCSGWLVAIIAAFIVLTLLISRGN